MIIEDFPMVPLSKFTPEILLVNEKITSEIAEHYVREAAIEFMERSQVIVREVTVKTQACVEDYPLDLPTCERIVSIQASCGTRLQRHKPCDIACGCTSRAAWFTDLNTLHITGVQTDGDEITLRVAVAPTRDACEVAAELYERYYRGVVSGAIQIMKSLTDDTSRLKAWEGSIVGAGMDRLTGGLRGPFRFKGRRVL